MLTLGLKAGGPPAVQTKAPRSCCLERLCWEGAVLCLALEGSLEFSNRMRFFDREPFSATLVGAGRTFETNHLALRVVRIATPLLAASLTLRSASTRVGQQT